MNCPICCPPGEERGAGDYRCAHCNNSRIGDLDHICPACPGSMGLHECGRCEGTGEVISYEDLYGEDDLRDINLDGYRLQAWDTGQVHRGGPQWCLAYRLTDPEGYIVFEAADYGCAPGDAVDGDESIRGLLSFLTLKDGDTDDEYFYSYTRRQREFSEGPAEDLSLWSMDPEGYEPNEDEEEEYLFVDWNKNDDGTDNEEVQQSDSLPGPD